MNKDLNKTKEQLSLELNDLRKKCKEHEEMQKAADQQLLATEQQLRAANQQLELNNQQLRAVNQELIASEQRFSKYFQQSLIGMTITSPEKEWIEVNEVLCEMLGYTKEELHKMTWVEITHSDDLETDLCQFNRMLANEIDSYIIEKRFIHKDGHIVYAAVSMNASRNMIDQSVENVLAIVYDITKIKQAEEELQVQSKFIDDLIESSALSTWISDKNGIAIRANHACLDFFGATTEEVVGKYNLFKDEVLIKQGLIPVIKKVFEEGEVVNIISDYNFGNVGHINVKNATHKVIKSIFTPIKDKNNKVINAVCHTMDLTDIKQAEDALKESEKNLRQIIDLVPHFIYVKDEDGKNLIVNKAVADAYGTTVEEIVGEQDVNKTSDKEGAAKFIKDDLEVINSGKQKFIPEEQLIDSEGNIRFLETTKIPFKTSMTKKRAILGISIDITKRKQAEAEMKKRLNELEIFNEVTVGRELKVIELKKEINQLLAKTGQKPKYEIVK